MCVSSVSGSVRLFLYSIFPYLFQFWAVFVRCSIQYKDAVRQSLDQADVIKRFINKYPQTFKFVTTSQGKF